MDAKAILINAVILGGVGGLAWASIPPAMFMSDEEAQRIETSVHYSGCYEVRALGKAPIRAGEPGYRETMDGDGDGVACEPIR
ncbi:excalibur calcium-binding domain-containing protein [Sphingomonas sp. LY29]|uniref:excalibur calcium-binding domain-containing protein n=1 Tax=Sphingomonas sp. LY29 TaxID=3095341 RepID=UPI002D769083|nr:excalibur calcium-binding domain-containing protein [Sphingomonas sp. LY29]WRP25187.1 excalibur calcium-binding domain-containing protein [Sphingomonas sp. LY29]